MDLVVIMAIITIGFAIGFTLVFGHSVYEFRSVRFSCWTLMAYRYGDFDIEVIVAASYSYVSSSL